MTVGGSGGGKGKGFLSTGTDTFWEVQQLRSVSDRPDGQAQVVTYGIEAFSLRPRKPEDSLGRTVPRTATSAHSSVGFLKFGG